MSRSECPFRNRSLSRRNPISPVIARLLFTLISVRRTQLVALALCCFLPPVAVAQSSDSEARLRLLEAEWERDPGNLKLALLLGGALRHDGRNEEARNVVDASMQAATDRIEKEGDSAESQYMLGMAALFLNRNYIAKARFETALSLQPEREEAHLGLVRSLLSLEKEDQALEALSLAQTLFPESEAVKSQLAELHERAGRFREALPILEELQAFRPDDTELMKRLLRAAVESGEVERAGSLLDQMTQSGELSELEAALQLFRIQLSKGDLREARRALQTASQADEAHPQVKRAFADYYAMQAGQAEAEENPRRAALFWERAVESVPSDGQLQYRLAVARAALGDHEKALAGYLPLLEQKPENPHFYGDLAQTLIALDQTEAASRVIRLGLELANTQGDREALKRLEEARDRLWEEANPPSEE